MSNETPIVPPPAANAPTAARTYSKSSSHWYRLNGEPCYEVPTADGKRMRKATLADARKLNLLPSVTTILKILHKEALVNWLIEQAALAVLTAPRGKDEALDAFVLRVLHTEEQQDQEAQIARDKGTAIHNAIELFFHGEAVPPDMEEWVRPSINAILAFGERASSEVVITGDDYAGLTDLIQDCETHWRLWDFKSTKKLPDPRKGGAWSEHRLQLSAYAKGFQDKLVRAGEGLKPILVGNIYISSQKPGEFVICEHEGWEETYQTGFAPLVTHWQWSTGYRVENPNRSANLLPAQVPVIEAPAQVQVEQMRQHYLAANARVEELERKLAEQLQPVAQEAREATVDNMIAAAKGLPAVSADGRKIQWSVGQATPAK